jgi:hypothetical protein
MLRRVALVRAGVSEEVSASFISVTRIGELGTTLAVTSNRRTLQRNANTNKLSTAHRVESGRVAGWDTILEAEMSEVRFLLRLLNLLNSLNLSDALWPWDRYSF